jgi:hypothetical protein
MRGYSFSQRPYGPAEPISPSTRRTIDPRPQQHIKKTTKPPLAKGVLLYVLDNIDDKMDVFGTRPAYIEVKERENENKHNKEHTFKISKKNTIPHEYLCYCHDCFF